MKTLYSTNGHSNICIDTENNSVERLDSTFCVYRIDDILLAKEPLHIVYQHGEYKQELDADEGDIIIKFDTAKTNANRIVVIKSEEFKENILNRLKEEEEAKLKWAEQKEKALNGAECDCEACNPA